MEGSGPDLVGETEHNYLAGLMTRCFPLDYLNVFEHWSEDELCDFPGIISPGSSSSSPAPTQQFDIGSFFDKSVEPRQLFPTLMPERQLQMFVSPVASLRKRDSSLTGKVWAALVREGKDTWLG